MIDTTNIDIIHELFNKKNEPMCFSIFAEGMGVTKFYLELRKFQPDESGILYYIVNGRMKDKGSLAYSFITNHVKYNSIETALRNFNFLPYVKTQIITKQDFERMDFLLRTNPLPSVEAKHRGLDGHTVTFHSFVGGDATYKYWVYPPADYIHLKEVVNIISSYIEAPYGKCLYLNTPRA